MLLWLVATSSAAAKGELNAIENGVANLDRDVASLRLLDRVSGREPSYESSRPFGERRNLDAHGRSGTSSQFCLRIMSNAFRISRITLMRSNDLGEAHTLRRDFVSAQKAFLTTIKASGER